jgi:transcriptional regulator with XRE-family HTH domain
MSEQTTPHIGQRVTDWRKRRGKSQRVLAGLAGITQGYLSMIESGRRSVDRRSTLVALAGALEVSVAELSGVPDPTDPAKARATASVPAIRAALVMREFGEARPAAAGRVADLVAAGTSYDFAGAAAMLPGLLGQATGAELVQVCHVATATLKHLGYEDLARDAARLSLAVARDLDDPAWIGVAEVNQLIGLPLEIPRLPLQVARRAAEEIQPQTGDPNARQAYGMLHLHAAIRAAVADDPSRLADHLGEAREAADSLGDPEDLGLAGLAFGPTNVDIWHVGLLAESGDMEQAAAVSERVEPRRIRAHNRRAVYWVDRGRALSAIRRDNEAVSAFLNAEAACPQWVRLRRNVKDTIGVILHRTRRNAVSKPLRRAAAMVGLHDDR